MDCKDTEKIWTNTHLRQYFFFATAFSCFMSCRRSVNAWGGEAAENRPVRCTQECANKRFQIVSTFGRVFKKWVDLPPKKQGVFWKKVFEAENKRNLRGSRKWLAYNAFRQKWKILATDGRKKSTPQKNLALTFFAEAFVRKWKKRQNSQNRMHKRGWSVQKSGVLALVIPQSMVVRGSETARKGQFSVYFASSPWCFFVEQISTKNCKQEIWVFMFFDERLDHVTTQTAEWLKEISVIYIKMDAPRGQTPDIDR